MCVLFKFRERVINVRRYMNMMQTKHVRIKWKWCWKTLIWWWESATSTWAASSWPALISFHCSSTRTSLVLGVTSRSSFNTARCRRSAVLLVT